MTLTGKDFDAERCATDPKQSSTVSGPVDSIDPGRTTSPVMVGASGQWQEQIPEMAKIPITLASLVIGPRPG